MSAIQGCYASHAKSNRSTTNCGIAVTKNVPLLPKFPRTKIKCVAASSAWLASAGSRQSIFGRCHTGSATADHPVQGMSLGNCTKCRYYNQKHPDYIRMINDTFEPMHVTKLTHIASGVTAFGSASRASVKELKTAKQSDIIRITFGWYMLKLSLCTSPS